MAANPRSALRLTPEIALRLQRTYADATARSYWPDLIHRFLEDTNANPKPFTWTKDPDKIIAAVKRGYQVLESIH
jgi:hypothetical protein